MIVFAFTNLVDNVASYLAGEAAASDPVLATVPTFFGWREPEKNSPTPARIVWVPGDDQNGAAGAFSPARFPGRNPRSLGTVDETFTCYLQSVDPTALESERAQYQVVAELRERWFRAVYHSARGTYALTSIAWETRREVRRFGAALRIIGTVQTVLADTDVEVVPIDAHAVIDVHELDHTAQLTTEEI